MFYNSLICARFEAGAGEGNRTLVFSLEGCCSTIELHPHLSENIAISENDLFSILSLFSSLN